MNLKYIDGHSMTEHTSNFISLVNQFVAMEIEINDEMQVFLLLILLLHS